MPPTRAVPKTRHTIRQPTDQEDIIVISSSDTEDSAGSAFQDFRQKARRRSKRPSTPLRPRRSIVEVSDDEVLLKHTHRDDRENSYAALNSLKELQALQTTNARLEAENKRLRTQVHVAEISKPKLDQSKLEDYLCCEICTGKLWAPYILPDCGHTFCESCLSDWFSTALAKHMTTHPRYQPNQPPQVPYYMTDILRSATPEQYRQITAIFPKPIPDPEYSCPLCRTTVQTPPVEEFAIKNLVRIVADAKGEKSPTKQSFKSRGKGRQTGPWEGFFA